ncbi:MAG: M13-type metalloendopeptidase, partial [Asticcacaulis sp.]
ALDAYHLSLKGKDAPVIEGLDGDQRLLLSYAQSWQGKQRDDSLKMQLVSDVHSPYAFRVIGPMRNVDAWYKAFNVQPGEKYYLKPEDRVRIW